MHFHFVRTGPTSAIIFKHSTLSSPCLAFITVSVSLFTEIVSPVNITVPRLCIRFAFDFVSVIQKTNNYLIGTVLYYS